MPFLVRAIKENRSELIRTNAAHMLGAMRSPCVRGLIRSLEKEATKTGTTAEQQARLRAAEAYIGKFYPPCDSETCGQ